MAHVIPFRGWRYDLEEVGDASLVLAPPYDVISDQQREAFIKKHPRNIVRLTLGLDPLGTQPTRSRYELAAADLREWRREGTLVQDEQPVFYLYEQEYRAPSLLPQEEGESVRRRGVIGLVKLEEYDKGAVLPHEGTLEPPKADRLQLLQAAKCALSQVFGIYSDPELTVQGLAEHVCDSPPVFDITCAEGVAHRMWVIQDESACQRLTEMFADRTIVIADGHHRYETALAYRDQQREANGEDPGAPSEFVSMFLCNADAGQLSILPCHRLIKELPLDAEAALWRVVMDVFETERVQIDSSSDASRAEGIHGLLRQMAQSVPDEHTFALYAGGNYALLLHLHDMQHAMQLGVEALPRDLRELDVALLHKLVIEGIMGLSGDQAATGVNILYSRDGHDAANRVARGEAAMVLFINTTRVQQVMAIATAGDHMPQKGTYFYPKALAGLVLHDLRGD